MSRPWRLLAIFSALLLVGSLLALWLAVPGAGRVAAATASVLVVLAGLRLRGNRPGFTRVERRRVFGHWGD